MRKGRVCRKPPMKVIRPVTNPRKIGLPRPVSSPSSEMPSEKSNLFYNRYAVAERQSREEALAARERAVEARERQLGTLAAQRHDRFEL